jgi:hypothetical protein
MGACDFGATSNGKTAKEAFVNAVEQAQWDHGHGGYTGTIAEKHEFVIITVPAGVDPIKFADELVNKDDPRIRDKWGPAGCVKISEGEFYFFGLASS